jgi:hypothetical protein
MLLSHPSVKLIQHIRAAHREISASELATFRSYLPGEDTNHYLRAYKTFPLDVDTDADFLKNIDTTAISEDLRLIAATLLPKSVDEEYVVWTRTSVLPWNQHIQFTDFFSDMKILGAPVDAEFYLHINDLVIAKSAYNAANHTHEFVDIQHALPRVTWHAYSVHCSLPVIPSEVRMQFHEYLVAVELHELNDLLHWEIPCPSVQKTLHIPSNGLAYLA